MMSCGVIDHMRDASIIPWVSVVEALEAMLDDPRCPVPKRELALRLRRLAE